MEKWEIRLSGSGGQGVISAAVFLAQAALYDGNNAIQTQVYGPESRGGSTKGETVISAKEIHYPKVVVPNVVLCLTKQAQQKFGYEIQNDGFLIIDSTHCDTENVPANAQVYALPIIDMAADVVGNVLCANVLSIGIILGLTDLVSLESMEEAIRGTFKPKVAELNVKALHLGYEEAKSLLL